MRHSSLEIILRERGPENWPALTLELDYPFCQELGEALKDELPKGTRIWYGDGDEKWHVHPDYKEQVVEIAYRFFPSVYYTEGTKSVEVKTGWQRPEQPALLF